MSIRYYVNINMVMIRIKKLCLYHAYLGITIRIQINWWLSSHIARAYR